MNISKNGMFIKARKSLTVGSEFNILIPLIEESMKIFARVVRLIKVDSMYHAIGVEILKPKTNYLQFVENISVDN